MSQPLFPVVEVPDFISEDSQYDTQYKRSMKWNTELGDFVRDGRTGLRNATAKKPSPFGVLRLHRQSGPLFGVPRFNR